MSRFMLKNHLEKDKTLRVKRSAIGCILSIILVPAGSFLDWFFYPDFFSEFVILRWICSLSILIILALHYTDIGKRNIKYLNFIWITLLQILLCWIIFVTDKHLSTYYASLNIVVLAIAIILPLKTSEMAIFCIITMTLYIFAIFDTPLSQPEILFNNIYFIILSSIVSIMASYINSKHRFREFCLNYELDEKNKKLAELDKIKSQFFANISHEFRTPLTLIMGPAEDILKNNTDKISDKITNSVELIQRNAIRLLKLINNLLDIARLEEKKYEVVSEKIEISNLIGGFADSLSHLANSKKVKLVKNIPNQKLYISADPDAMEKIILNLLTNAIKFTNSNGKIIISLKCVEEKVLIFIEDSGIGIHEENLPYIFDRFKQVDNSNTRKYQGSGLGLALVKELTLLQKGHIDVKSMPDQGTIFTLTFPKLQQEEMQPLPPEINLNKDDFKPDICETNEKSDINQQLKTVLIVDDEPDMLRYTTSLLKNENYNIIQAEDGKSALEMIYKYGPDLVILDLMIPEIDGLSLCKKLKSDERTRLIKIIILTARIDEKSKLTALKYGVDDFVNKPFNSNELKVIISNNLQSNKLQKDLYLDLNESLKKLHIAQNKLIQSEKLNSLGSLSAGILHEVKNPLNYMITALYSLKYDPTIANDPDLIDTVNDIEEGMERIKTVVSDIRSFAHPKEIEKIKFPIKSAIDSALRIAKQEVRNIKVELVIDNDMQVIASNNHIIQVLINLISNAAKAIEDSKNKTNGKIVISCKQEKGKILISVSDNGTGISEENLKVIFNPFFTTKDIGSGMGMGLNISYTIIKSHNSELKVTSDLSEGSSFYFELPS